MGTSLIYLPDPMADDPYAQVCNPRHVGVLAVNPRSDTGFPRGQSVWAEHEFAPSFGPVLAS